MHKNLHKLKSAFDKHLENFQTEGQISTFTCPLGVVSGYEMSIMNHFQRGGKCPCRAVCGSRWGNVLEQCGAT
jgi:hypothetical protein